MIGVLDIGNVVSIERSLLELGRPFSVVSDTSSISSYSHLIMPGVGHFDSSISLLHKRDLWSPVSDFLLDPAKKFLGICVGMQILFSGSEEGVNEGFSMFDGGSIRLCNNANLPLPPHMGFTKFSHPTEQLKNDTFYYMHSFGIKSEYNHPGTFSYGGESYFGFVKDERNNWGAQFHPERSGLNGLNFFRDFLEG